MSYEELEEQLAERKSKMKDDKGRYITQSLFLEVGYDTDKAIFTLDGEDKKYKGVLYPSLKKQYMNLADPIEYTFATTYLYDWEHWNRITNNKMLLEHISKWREELELHLMSEGVLTLIDLAKNDKSYQAGKWLADHGWAKNSKGRPSKEEIEGHIKKAADKKKEYESDFKLLNLKEK
tara:strand:+ start:229 stop:762 length:534 start_codon:yes stop_codon:yes gene_type:complete